MARLIRADFQRSKTRRQGDLHRLSRPAKRRRISLDFELFKLALLVGGLLIGALAIGGPQSLGFVAPVPRHGIGPRIEVVDGDTVRSGSAIYRLVGFNTPETGENAGCGRERALAAKATARLRELLAQGEVELEAVSCACLPGTEGSEACNYGRRCGRLSVGGKDIAAIMIAEGLAERYVCRGTPCPRRKDWCAS